MTMWIDSLYSLSKKNKLRAVGLMSGTSADGIDVAICDFTLENKAYKAHTLVAYESISYKPETKQAILNAEKLTVKEISELDITIGQEFAGAMKQTLHTHHIDPQSIEVIGSHGQTIYHHSAKSGEKASLQLGCADAISAAMHTPVFFDFRRKDIVRGGEGAPLTPFSDWVFFAGAATRAVLNLGGIANITVLAPKVEEVIGFDTGPANAPLDRLTTLITNGAQTFDKDGKLSASGTSNPALLKKIFETDTYVTKHPPKSTGFEMYGDSFVRYVISLNGGVIDVHLLATVTEFVAKSISYSIKKFVPSGSLSEVIVAGGGARNETLMKCLRNELQPISIVSSDPVGVPADAREAVAFALFAVYALMGNVTSIPKVTGASEAAVLGKLSWP